jgi:hypothetical protein
MTGSEVGRAASWYGRVMRIALPFGLVSLAWNIVQAYGLVTGADSPRPVLAVITILLNTSIAAMLIWQGLVYLRRPRA